MKLMDFDTLTFDCYGTLIDWESGLFTALQPLMTRTGVTLDRDAVLAVFAQHESAQQAATPDMPYADLLSVVHAQLAELWGAAPDAAADRRFGESVGDWPAFPDTAEALAYLKQHYKLVILSNVDRGSFQGSLPRLGVAFDAIYTAQDIGSYKPDPRNFVYLIEHLAEAGVKREQILHTAQSLFHDHAPANAAGLVSAWIDRRHAAPGFGATAEPPAGVRWDFRFRSMAEMADAHRAEAAG
jgi:2-haloalkanoic acid dehalogenase type II